MTIIREALVADAEIIHSLGESVSEFVVNEKTVAFWPKATLRNAIESRDVSVSVAEDEGSIVGFIIAGYNEGLKKAIIENVFVVSEYRAKGIGDALLSHLLQELRSRECEYVITLIPTDAAGARNLYTNIGFIEGETFLWLDLPLSSGFTLVR